MSNPEDVKTSKDVSKYLYNIYTAWSWFFVCLSLGCLLSFLYWTESRSAKDCLLMGVGFFFAKSLTFRTAASRQIRS